jgi:hypothetical protein
MKCYSTRFWALVLLLQTILFSCSGLRTEIYREETRHRYNQACKLTNRAITNRPVRT